MGVGNGRVKGIRGAVRWGAFSFVFGPSLAAARAQSQPVPPRWHHRV